MMENGFLEGATENGGIKRGGRTTLERLRYQEWGKRERRVGESNLGIGGKKAHVNNRRMEGREMGCAWLNPSEKHV